MGFPAYSAVALLPIALPASFLLYMYFTSSSDCTVLTGSISGDVDIKNAPKQPESLPEAIRKDPSAWVVSYERAVSPPLPISTLRYSTNNSSSPNQPSDLLRAYLSTAHVTFSWTPQAFLIRAMISEKPIRRTFERDYLTSIPFKVDDLVNGVYCVTYYGGEPNSVSERAELAITAPASYKGAAPEGRLVAAVEELQGGESVVVVNETWLWRRKEDKPTMLESPGGRWFHALLGRWLLSRGMYAVVAATKGKVE